jgi:hypothetical protein
MFKVTVSGNYRTNNGSGETVDFDNVVGLMPECDEKMVLSHVGARFIGDWINDDPRYKGKRFNSARSTYVDGIEVVKGLPRCNGKDIRKMEWSDIQDLAVAKNLLRIQTKNTVDLRVARGVAYMEYAKLVGKVPRDVNGKEMSINNPDDFIKLPALFVDGQVESAPDDIAQTNEEAIAEARDVDSDLTIAELRTAAKKAGIQFSNKTTKKELLEMFAQRGGQV